MTVVAEEARLELLGLSEVSQEELAAILDDFGRLDPEEFQKILREVLPVLGREYELAAATLGADYFDAARRDAGARGTFVAEPVAPVETERWDALADWGVAPMLAGAGAYLVTRERVLGGTQRTIADKHRETVTKSAIADPQASGWNRVVSPLSKCGFCKMLADRGAIYSDDTVTFRAHEPDDCTAAPSWDQNAVKVSEEPYKQSKRNRSKATKKLDNARAYEFIKDRYGVEVAT